MKKTIRQPIETLRLNDREKTKLLWAIEQANKREIDPDQRRLRVSCTEMEGVLSLHHDTSACTPLSVILRNLSRWGAAVVHGRYVHPHTKCELTLPSKGGGMFQIVGRIRHCRHLQGTIHEIGVRFAEPLELTSFVTLSPLEEARYLKELAEDATIEESQHVTHLSHKVLIADDFPSNRNLYAYWLGQAGLTVTTVGEARVARVQIQEQVFDLIVMECVLGDEETFDLIRELRASNFTAPIVAMSASESTGLRDEALSSGATVMMHKPFDEDDFIETAYQLIGIDRAADHSPIYSTLRSDSEMRPLLTQFTRSIPRCIEELRDANVQNDYAMIDHISQRLKGAGKGYGFPKITAQASDLLVALHQDNADLQKIKQATTELIAMLNRVKLG